MLQLHITGRSAVQHSSGITTTEREETRQEGTKSTIKKMLRDLRDALQRCSQKTFRRFDKDGNEMKGKLNVSKALELLENLERAVPRFMIFPGNRKRAVELLAAIQKTVDKSCKAIDLLNPEIRTPNTATEAARILEEVFDEQQNLIRDITTEIPDESKLRHIRDIGQSILLIVGIAAFVLNIFSFGLPFLIVGLISLAPVGLGFSWNRIYDWCTTPCPVWKPMRELVSEIRHSVERSNMFATSVINRLEPRIDRLEPRIDRLEPMISQLEPRIDRLEPMISQLEPRIDRLEPMISQLEPRIDRLEPMISQLEPRINQVESGIKQMESEMMANLASLRNEVADIREDVRKDMNHLRTEFQNLSALMMQVLSLKRQGAAGPSAANTQDAANEPPAALHIAQFG